MATTRIGKSKGKVLDIDRWLGTGAREKVRSRIYLFGLELEGAWDKLPPGYNWGPDNHDGSVNPREKPVFPPNPELLIGEIPSDPMELVQVGPWVKKFFPTHVKPETCGLHVHMSFLKSLYYGWLADTPDYQETLIHYLGRWAEKEGLAKTHPIWPRLAGKSKYCTKTFWPDLQIVAQKDHNQERDGNRYTMVNYCWTAHGTIEVRVLPMMDTAAQSIRAIHAVADITNAVLAHVARREKALHGTVKADGGPGRREKSTIYL